MVYILVTGLTENLGGVESFLYNYISNLQSAKLHFDFLCYEKQTAYEKQ